MFKTKTHKGFSLIEVLLVLGIIAILSGLSIPAFISFQQQNDLEMSLQKTVSTLRRGQSMARSQQNDSSWSVHTENSTVTLFKGADFSFRDTSFDEKFDFPQTITFSSVQNLSWQKLSGFPISSQTIILNGPNGNKTITINAKGTITY